MLSHKPIRSKLTPTEAKVFVQNVIDVVAQHFGACSPQIDKDIIGWADHYSFSSLGVPISLTTYLRVKGDEGFLWEPGSPTKGGDTFRQSVDLIYNEGECAHPDCEYCEHGTEVRGRIATKDDLVRWLELCPICNHGG